MKAVLRVDQIRHNTLTELVTHWDSNAAQKEILLSLDNLSEAVTVSRDGEQDDLVQQVEDAAAMADAEVELDLANALRLRNQLDKVIATLARFNPAAAARPVPLGKVPAQPERGAAA
ncbi:MAG: hypothetical protein M3R09_10910 [Actinomycetota bacterium]|nr:hypothetical protein [Actinomycetota bacterium]